MIFNQNLLLSTTGAVGQTITATAISANVIDWGTTGTVPMEAAAITRNLGLGLNLPLAVLATEAFATLTSLTITAETADNAALSSNAVVLATTGAVLTASLVLGWQPTGGLLIMPNATMKRYFGLRFTVAGSNATTGKIFAAIGTFQG